MDVALPAICWSGEQRCMHHALVWCPAAETTHSLYETITHSSTLILKPAFYPSLSLHRICPLLRLTSWILTTGCLAVTGSGRDHTPWPVPNHTAWWVQQKPAQLTFGRYNSYLHLPRLMPNPSHSHGELQELHEQWTLHTSLRLLMQSSSCRTTHGITIIGCPYSAQTQTITIIGCPNSAQTRTIRIIAVHTLHIHGLSQSSAVHTLHKTDTITITVACYNQFQL